jgi:hypothetical protein
MEVRILELCAAFFLLFPLLRPLFKALWGLNGLVILPVLALLLIIGIYPAYGFRPESLPLLAFAVFFNIVNFPAFLSLFSKIQNDDYRDRSLLFTVVCLLLFGFSSWIAWRFSPPLDFELDRAAETVSLRSRNGEESLYARIYRPSGGGAADDGAGAGGKKPLFLLIPPVAGSIPVIDRVGTELGRRGYTVLAYSRPGFDSPAVDDALREKRLSLPGQYRLANALLRSSKDAAANDNARALEEGRKDDILFLLEEIAQNTGLRDKLSVADTGRIFIAAWGAGGAAATSLAAQPGFGSGRVKGIAAIEAPVYSAYRGQAFEPLDEPGGNPVAGFFLTIADFFRGFVPRPVTGLESAPRPRLPALFIVSDRAQADREGRYKTVWEAAGKEADRVKSLPGAGPFDYSDSPLLYPVYSFLFRGVSSKDEAPDSRDAAEWPKLTAQMLADFAKSVTEGGAVSGQDW